MGREIRRVPLDWEHPKKENGDYKPLYDESYGEASEKWKSEFAEYESGATEEMAEWKRDYPKDQYWDYSGMPPDIEYYREREWTTEEAVGYQIYQNVSEGTPISPIFPSEEEMLKWLIAKGHSEKAATAFIKAKFAMSMVSIDGRMATGIDTYDLMN